MDGVGVRRKVRLRYYGDVETPGDLGDRVFFLEMKHRVKDCVHKDRLRLVPERARELLADPRLITSAHRALAEPSPENAAAVKSIEWMAAARQLRPANVISYRREAWMVRKDVRLRLTFDQTVHAYQP